MNLTFCLDDGTAKEWDRTTRNLGKTRSVPIREALCEWLDKKTLGGSGWPLLILEWQGAPDMLPFECEDVRGAAQLRASLSGQGTPIGADDLRLVPCGAVRSRNPRSALVWWVDIPLQADAERI